MDLDLISPVGIPQINKILFNLRGPHENGLILQVHPSFIDVHGDRRKCKFLHSTFSENNLLALSDNSGNLYIIDMEMEKYWQLPLTGTISAISFLPAMKSNLMVALCSGNIEIVHIESGNITMSLVGHSIAVKNITFSSDGKYSLTSNSTEAIIWDLSSGSQAHKFSLKEEMLLKKAFFMPVQDYIFTCFEDDAINIWKFGTFECIKQIFPEGWRTHQLKCVAFTKNGRAMVISGCNRNIAVFCLDTWAIKKIIELPESVHSIKYMEFLPQPFDGGANKILGILTNNLEISFLNIDSSLYFNNLPGFDRLIEYFSVSPSGKYLANVLASGEVHVYLAEKILDAGENVSVNMHCISPQQRMNVSKKRCRIKPRKNWSDELKAVHEELKEELTLRKLVPILKQFGEYPESYRVIIWRTILQLPMNQEAYVSLSNRECHPSYVNVTSKYTLVNKALSNTLKRVLSSLSYWCPLFGEVSYLPEFVFPFVKLFHSDPFICFESVVTIIVNWCQNWFEFYPFPPINVLSMIENVLAYHDSDLMEFYYKKNITSSSYACILMQTAFSEVLNKKEWLRLWDHIISNEPSFLIMCIVAYNVVCRIAIKNCDNIQDIQEFFHKQISVDVKLLLSKSYNFLEKTPGDIHPRQYLSQFSALEKGNTYQSFEAYPKLILDENASRLQLIQKERQEIMREQRKVIAMRKELDKKLKSNNETDLREEMLLELDGKFRQILNTEEERISAQRRKLQNLRHELKLRELSVLEEVRSQILKKKSQKRETEMERLLNDITKRKARDKCELEAIEEEIRKYYSSLLLRKYQLRLDLEMNAENGLKDVSKEILQEEDRLKEELKKLQSELAEAYDDRKFELASKITNITETLQRIETDVAYDLFGRSAKLRKSKSKIESLWKETESLQKKLEKLLDEDVNTDDHSSKDMASKTAICVCKDKCSTRTPAGDCCIESNTDVKRRIKSNRSPGKWEKIESLCANGCCKAEQMYGSCNNNSAKVRSIFVENSKISSDISQACSSDCEKNTGSDWLTNRIWMRTERMPVSPRSVAKEMIPPLSTDQTDLINSFCESDTSSCISDENCVVQMAMSEREKLIEKAKHYQSPS